MSVWVTREADTSTMRLFGSFFSENGGSGEQTGEMTAENQFGLSVERI